MAADAIGCSLAEAAESPAYERYLEEAGATPNSLHVRALLFCGSCGGGSFCFCVLNICLTAAELADTGQSAVLGGGGGHARLAARVLRYAACCGLGAACCDWGQGRAAPGPRAARGPRHAPPAAGPAGPCGCRACCAAAALLAVRAPHPTPPACAPRPPPPRPRQVVYINTSLKTKALAHEQVPTITCTSSNVVQTVLTAFAQVRQPALAGKPAAACVWAGPARPPRA